MTARDMLRWLSDHTRFIEPGGEPEERRHFMVPQEIFCLRLTLAAAAVHIGDGLHRIADVMEKQSTNQASDTNG